MAASRQPSFLHQYWQRRATGDDWNSDSHLDLIAGTGDGHLEHTTDHNLHSHKGSRYFKRNVVVLAKPMPRPKAPKAEVVEISSEEEEHEKEEEEKNEVAAEEEEHQEEEDEPKNEVAAEELLGFAAKFTYQMKGKLVEIYCTGCNGGPWAGSTGGGKGKGKMGGKGGFGGVSPYGGIGGGKSNYFTR